MALSGAMSAASGTAPTVLPRPTPLNAAPLATLVIVGAVVVFFVVTMASETMDFALVCANPRLAIMTPLASYYRVFTSTFAHGSFPHVLFNCLAFTPMASALERSVGTINFAWLFVVFAHVGYAIATASAYATLVARKDTVGPLSCVVLAAVVNFVGDYLMVAVFKTGAAGAAWATTASLYTGLIAITLLLKKRGLLRFPPKQNFRGGAVSFLRAMIPTKAQVAPVMPFFGPITFLVAALLAIYTTQILAANALGVTVSAAHRIAATLFSFTVLCGDPLVQAGQAFMPEHIINPVKANARKMAMILFQFGLFTAAVCSSGFAAFCFLGAGVFTTDAAVIAQLQSVVLPMSATVVANILSKSLYGVMVAARALNFLAGLTGLGLLGFAAAMLYLDRHVVGLAKYSYIWWITFAYYGLASLILFCRINGIVFKSILRDDAEDDDAKAAAA